MSVRTHNILDYVVGFGIALAPSLFGLSEVGTAFRALLALGVTQLALSLTTRYRFSMLRILSLRMHFVLEAILATILMLSPWINRYSDEIGPVQLILHFFLGGVLWSLAVFTRVHRSGSSLSEHRDRMVAAGRRR